uniref:Uncharacterized protein n=1 Tax=Chrysemys picta bellii TaxID=8478 RepID=A0A8C3I0N4_CHRPI
MAFTAFCYMLALLLTAALIFFAIWHIINPIDQCNTLNPLVLPEYLIHAFFCVMFLCAAEWLTLGLNMPVLLSPARPLSSCPGRLSPGPSTAVPPPLQPQHTAPLAQCSGWSGSTAAEPGPDPVLCAARRRG